MDGSTVTADDAYLRESILAPNAKIVAGFQPLMPTFQGQLTEEEILALTAYIKSLQSQPVPATGAGIAPPEVMAASRAPRRPRTRPFT